jgi:phosphoenolpyruvate carboxykinase (GTP)
MVSLCQPDRVYLADGSDREFSDLVEPLVKCGQMMRLKRPGSYACWTDPRDVARSEQSTWIATASAEDVGPLGQWIDPLEIKKELLICFNGSMKGRTMYIVPYCMGPLSSSYSLIGIELTDSPYVVLHMHKMTRMGAEVLARLGKEGPFYPGLHSVGCPLLKGAADVSWPCNVERRAIVHFPKEKLVWSYGSGYGGNALLGKKCLSLRIASVKAKEEGWFAEHMLILGITNPEGKKRYFAAAFPSACGKTNLAMLKPSLPGWKIETVGDDIAWLHIRKEDQTLWAINPEAGYFGVAPYTSKTTNPYGYQTISHDTLFTNVAITQDRDVWWEGYTPTCPEGVTSWRNVPYDPKKDEEPAAHPNSRFAVRATQNPIFDPASERPEGVPISAILFGGRRRSLLPLCWEALSFEQGVFWGATLSSETTAAADGKVGQVRFDPFAMRPFFGYHVGDYFAHWLSLAKVASSFRMYRVNWFLEDAKGNLLWPGYGDNIRVLKWIFERLEGTAQGEALPFGIIPQGLDVAGLKVDLKALFPYRKQDWLKEMALIESFFETIGSRMPGRLFEELEALRDRVENLSY